MLLSCPQCQAKVNGEEVTSHEYMDGDPGEGGIHARVILFGCPQCTEPMLVRQYESGSYQDDWGHETVTYAGNERIYPVERTIHAKIPETIRRSFAEARRCLEHRCYIASAIMCRRTLEALCKHHDTKGKNLAKSLEELHEAKVIDDRLYEWAEALRADGNLAAHDPEATFARQDAEDLAEFSEAILEYVFVLSDRFAAFKVRRAKAQGSAGQISPQLENVSEGTAE